MAYHFSTLACIAAALAIATHWSPAAHAQAVQTASDQTIDDPLKMPEGNFNELVEFLKKLQFSPPLENRARAIAVMEQTAQQILAIATDAEKKSADYNDVLAFVIGRNLADRLSAPAEQVRILNQAKQIVTTAEKFSPLVANLADLIPLALESSGRTAEAAKAYSEFSEILLSKKDSQFRDLGERLAGSARRLNLIGNPLELSGTLMSGKPFNWDSYRGKVVLVDFWATWCGPCIAEQPNVQANYDKYHQLGFEVVGLSLDRDRPALEKYLEKERLPWVTIHDGDWFANKVAQYYGIISIPTVLLVDIDGKVVDLNARGPTLAKQLERLLGPTEEAEMKQQ